MKAKDLISILQKNPEADIIIQNTPDEEYSLYSCQTAHSFQVGDVILEEEYGEDYTESTDSNNKLLVPVIILS